MHFQPFAFPRRLKPQLVVVNSTARLKPCPFKSRVPSHPSKLNFNSARLIVRLKIYNLESVTYLEIIDKEQPCRIEWHPTELLCAETNLRVEFNPLLGGFAM